MDKKKIKSKRATILNGAYNKKVINKGNRNVYSERHCCLCGRKLSSYISLEDDYICICKHYSFQVLGFSSYLCYNINSCLNHLNK